MNKKLRVKKSELSHFDESTKKGICDFGTFFFFGQFVGEEVIESKVLKSVTHQVNS